MIAIRLQMWAPSGPPEGGQVMTADGASIRTKVNGPWGGENAPSATATALAHRSGASGPQSTMTDGLGVSEGVDAAGITKPAGGTWKAATVATHDGLGAGLDPANPWSERERRVSHVAWYS